MTTPRTELEAMSDEALDKRLSDWADELERSSFRLELVEPLREAIRRLRGRGTAIGEAANMLQDLLPYVQRDDNDKPRTTKYELLLVERAEAVLGKLPPPPRAGKGDNK